VQTIQGTEPLADGERLGDHFAGVTRPRHGVDDRDLSCCGEFDDGIVVAGADHDGVNTGAEDRGSVGDRFTLTKLQRQVDPVGTQVGDRGIERQPSAEGRAVEDRGDPSRASGQRLAHASLPARAVGHERLEGQPVHAQERE
jgi:hypothetical protein